MNTDYSWMIVKILTITIFNRYLNDSEYYHDSETKIWIQLLSFFFHLWQRNQVLSLIHHSYSPPTETLALSSYIFHVVVGMLWLDNVKCTCL